MANQEQLELLKQGHIVWNNWRDENPDVELDLINANLMGADLRVASLRKANLSEANLMGADLSGASLHEANLSEANLRRTDLSYTSLVFADLRRSNLSEAKLLKATLQLANLTGADLRGADLNRADLTGANLMGADLRGAYLGFANLNTALLNGANLTGANLTGATLLQSEVSKTKVSGCIVYGISVWDLVGEFEEQKDLVITPDWGPVSHPVITVDNIKVAQFMYLILNNKEVRDVINTLTSKSVLILGRFTPERKAILDALKNKLREYNLLPIVFDFERPDDRDFTETIQTLAGLCYFVIADITNPKSSPLELQATVPNYQVPFVPIIQEGEQPFAMMVDLQKKYPWVLDTLTYNSIDTLIEALKPAIIDPAIKKHNELKLIKARGPKIMSVEDFIDDKGLE